MTLLVILSEDDMKTQVFGQRCLMLLFGSFLLFYFCNVLLYILFVKIFQNNGFLEIPSIIPQPPL